MFLVALTFNEDGEETAAAMECADRFPMIDDGAAKGTKEIEQPREFISSVLCVW